MKYLVVSPYLVPDNLRDSKAVNLGDGFILRAIERLTGKFSKEQVFSSREPIPEAGLKLLQQSRAVLVAGANQLNDRYTVLPGLSVEELRTMPCPIIPIGVGIHGLPEQTSGMSDTTRAILREVHSRISYSSWRCPLTIQYLSRELPDLKHQFLMTGCPVIYDDPLLSGSPFSKREGVIAVTTTERGDFWQREVLMLQFVAKRFPHAKRYLVLHQNFTPPSLLEPLVHRILPAVRTTVQVPSELRRFARSLGYKVVIPSDADQAIQFYQDVDLHLGSRLHAHLLFLSRAKRSFLIGVDERAAGLAEAFGFPLCIPSNLSDYLDLDFEQVRVQARKHYQTLTMFLEHTLPLLKTPMVGSL
jgi:hypothetical protein